MAATAVEDIDRSRRTHREPTHAEQFAVDRLETGVVMALLVAPEFAPHVFEVIQPADFRDPRLGSIAGVVARLYRDGLPITLPAVADELDQADHRLAPSEAAMLFAALDFSEATEDRTAVLDLARRVRWRSLQRRRALLASRVAGGDERDLAELVELDRQIEDFGSPQPHAALGLTGDRIREVLAEGREPSPLPGLLDDQPALHLLVGRPKIGKTTLGLHVAQSWACGVSPWQGAPALPGTRALIVSAEQPLRRVAATLSRLAERHQEAPRDDWHDRVEIVARDRALSRSALPLFSLGSDGLRALRSHLERAAKTGDPFGFVLLDSLSRLKPADVEENDADGMTAFLGPLAAMASDLGVYVQLVHHEGHAEGRSTVTAPRGSTSIAAVAQAVWHFELDKNRPNERTLTSTGNAIETTRLSFRVAPDDQPGKVAFFTPADPFAGADIDELLPAGETSSYSEVAERWLGSKSGPARTRAQQLVSHWRALGLVDPKSVRRTA